MENGAVLVKIWMEIDKDEQLKRFQERDKDPQKQWKITEDDWRNRDKWDFYGRAVDEMLFRTSTKLGTLDHRGEQRQVLLPGEDAADHRAGHGIQAT